MIAKIDTAPASEPLLLDEAKDHLHVSTTDSDAYIQTLITVARQHVESVTRRVLITQTWKTYLDRFPVGYNTVDLPKAPVQSITSVEYVDGNGVTQTLASTEYTLDSDSEPARFYLAYNKTWPTVRHVAKAITITFVAGYGGAEDVPDALKQAMLLLIGQWYEVREPVNIGNIVQTIPLTVDALLNNYRIYTL